MSHQTVKTEASHATEQLIAWHRSDSDHRHFSIVPHPDKNWTGYSITLTGSCGRRVEATIYGTDISALILRALARWKEDFE